MSEENKFFEKIVIIPTCGLPHLEQTMMRIFEKSEPEDLYILSMNPFDVDQAEAVYENIEACKEFIERKEYKTINLDVVWAEKPLGFGVACNRGYEHAVKNYETPISFVFLNDDVMVTHNWLNKMVATLHSGHYFTHSAAAKRDPVTYPISELGHRIGIVGPFSNEVGGEQRINIDPNTPLAQIEGMLNQKSYINTFNKEKNQGMVIPIRITTKFISGFCMMCHPEFLSEIKERDGFIFDPIYNVGGFEDNDICVRAQLNGWGCLIDATTYIHHKASSTLNKAFKDQQGGMANWDIYMKKWSSYTQRDQKLIGAYRVAFPTVNSLAQMGSSIRMNIKHLDGISVLLTAHPKYSLLSYDKALFTKLWPQDQDFLKGCDETEDPEKIAKLLHDWLEYYCPENFPIKVECWDFEKPMNERDERNKVYEMATEMDADWILSIDSDECIEDRVQKSDFQRLMKNPDPLAAAYTFGWLNHYESMNVIRCDKPYSMDYYSGMNGVRMWRVYNNHHQPIKAGNAIGLHCGNAPQYGAYTIHGTCIRFRHLSMVREVDRAAKVSYYNMTDTDRDPTQIGASNYFHIGRSENVKITLYNRNNGIGGFILSYEDENDVLVCQKIVEYYNAMDSFALVWTGEWEDEDKSWIELPVEQFPEKSKWRESYPTGPSHLIATVGKLCGIDWLHRHIKHGLGECRNAALEHFENIPRIGWSFYFDPDEFEENGQHRSEIINCLRRMSESTDNWGFRFKFVNPCRLKNGKIHHSISEAIRLIKSSKKLKLRFSGEVHETIEDRMAELKSQGMVPLVAECPLRFINNGLALNREKMILKMRKYHEGLISTLNKDPYRSQSWCALGLSYEQDGDEVNAEICYERACLTAGTAFMPFKLLATFYARRAAGLFHKAGQHSSNVKEMSQSMFEVFEFLHGRMGEFPAIDTGSTLVSTEFELPPFPYEDIQYDDRMNQVVIRKSDVGTDNNGNQGNQ